MECDAEQVGLKVLRMKSGMVKRLAKEQQHYENEAESLKSKIQEMKDQGQDAYQILKQQEILDESLKMVPNCQKRLAKAFGELKDVIAKEERDLKETEEYRTGLKLLEETKQKISNAM